MKEGERGESKRRRLDGVDQGRSWNGGKDHGQLLLKQPRVDAQGPFRESFHDKWHQNAGDSLTRLETLGAFHPMVRGSRCCCGRDQVMDGPTLVGRREFAVGRVTKLLTCRCESPIRV